MRLNSTDIYDVEPNFNVSYNETKHHILQQGSGAFKDFLTGLNIYLTPIIIIVGVFGNVLSFLVFVATHLRRQSSSVYLAGLAIADVSFLLSLFIGWFSWLRIHLFHRNVWCQVVVYVTYVGSFLSVWCVVCFTAERYIIVSYPFKRQTLCTVKKARIVLISMSAFALTMYSFPLWTSGIIYHENLPYCTVLPKFTKAVFVLTTIDTFITLFLPSLIIIVLNIRITILVYKFSKKRDLLRNVTSTSSKRHSDRNDQLIGSCPPQRKTDTNYKHVPIVLPPNNQTRKRHASLHRPLVQMKITRMLLVVSTTFILLNLPSHVVRIQTFVASIGGEVDRSFVSTRFQELSQFLYYMSFSINFFLYSLCGRNFRRSLHRLMTRLKYNVRKVCIYVSQVVSDICSRHHRARDEHITVNTI